MYGDSKNNREVKGNDYMRLLVIEIVIEESFLSLVDCLWWETFSLCMRFYCLQTQKSEIREIFWVYMDVFPFPHSNPKSTFCGREMFFSIHNPIQKLAFFRFVKVENLFTNHTEYSYKTKLDFSSSIGTHSKWQNMKLHVLFGRRAQGHFACRRITSPLRRALCGGIAQTSSHFSLINSSSTVYTPLDSKKTKTRKQ